MNNICSLESPLSAPCLPGFQCILQEKSSPPICSSCRLGEFCPKGTINPSLSLANSICPEGNYCSTPANITVCPSGHFCPSGSVNPTACAMKGLYCEEGIASPSICPAGFYCPTSDQQILCPKGNFCKKFSIFPAACPALALCPEGSQYPGMKGRGILIFLGFSVLLCGLYWYIYAHFRRKQKNGMKVLLSRLDDYNLINAMFRSITGHAYDIYTFKGLIPKASKATIGFEKLSLTLKDGCSVLDGVTGEFKNSSLCAIMVISLYSTQIYTFIM